MRRYNSQQKPQKNEESDEAKQDGNSHSNQDENKLSYFQTLLQNYMFNTSNVMPTYNHNQSGHSQCQSHTCSSGMISSLFGIVSSQSQSLQSLNKKVEELIEKNKDLAKKVRDLQSQNEHLKSGERKRQEPEIYWKQALNQIKIEGESVNKQSLLEILFGKQKYEYKLKLTQPLDQPLYRERNFRYRINYHSIIMELVDMNDQKVQNSNKIPMSLALYTCENPPKFIEKNTAGQKMLKGYVDQALVSGLCHFQKVQIREVTSHYRGGWIFLVAIPCMTPLGANKIENFVEFTKIKPLVIDEVVVKAKKPKKKDQKKEQNSDEGV